MQLEAGVAAAKRLGDAASRAAGAGSRLRANDLFGDPLGAADEEGGGAHRGGFGSPTGSTRFACSSAGATLSDHSLSTLRRLTPSLREACFRHGFGQQVPYPGRG